MRILVIDDDEAIRTSIQSSLQSESFAVDTCADGVEGLYLASINPYDVIVLDYHMPNKNGDDVCRELRAKGIHTPILFLSIEGSVAQKVDMLNIGADDYLTKPFTFSELLARIRALLRRSQHMIEEELKVDELVLSTQSGNVKIKGKSIYLTRKEFSLLEYFLRNQGRLLSHSELMEHVWDKSLDPFSNTLETHILNLRKKIGNTQRKKFIRTIPGRGYILDQRR